MTTATKVVLKPLEDRIVVRPLEAEQSTASGLVIPDTAKEKPQEGEVLAVGPGRFDDAVMQGTEFHVLRFLSRVCPGVRPGLVSAGDSRAGTQRGEC